MVYTIIIMHLNPFTDKPLYDLYVTSLWQVGSKQSVADQEARLEFLELQLAQLIQGSKVSGF